VQDSGRTQALDGLNLSVVAGDVSLWPNLSSGEVIDLLAGLRGGADEDLRRELVEEFEFDPRKKARTYSKGNRQKVALIAALLPGCPAVFAG
jgi:ABC-2 type transport system ATP-binding protein